MILVFGSTGQVARELAAFADVTCLGREAADFEQPDACAAAIRRHAPDAVINAAAYTAVDKAEDDEARATRVNGDAPGAMARACAELGIPFVHISTDYVFPGTGAAPQAPDDPTGPVNAYGRSKLAGERAVLDSGARAVILRTSWVVSAHGANFVKTMLRLGASRDALFVVADQVGGPTPARAIAQACHKIARAMIAGESGTGVYHFSGAPDTSWADFAREIFRRSGQSVAVTDIPTRDYPTPAARPLNSRLDCSSLARDFGIERPDWRDGLTDILNDLEGAST